MTEDLHATSLAFPDVTIQVECDGEDGSQWREAFRNGERRVADRPEWENTDLFGDRNYTVIAHYQDADDAREQRTHVLHIQGPDPDQAARAAIDQHIRERGLDPEDMESFRAEYKVMAVFEGLLDNLKA